MIDPPRLSLAGQRRREHILCLAQAQARRQRRRRKAVPAAGIGAVMLMMTTLVIIHSKTTPRADVAVHPKPVTPSPAVVVDAQSNSVPRKIPHVVFSVIQTEPGLADRLAIHPPAHPAWRRLSDDDLIRELADAGHPAGLAWIDGRETLVFRGRHHTMETAPRLIKN